MTRAYLDSAPPRAGIIRRVGNRLSDLSPSTRAVVFGGAAVLPREQGGLRGLLRRRIESLLGEFRSTAGPLELLSVGGWPAVGLRDPEETGEPRYRELRDPNPFLGVSLLKRIQTEYEKKGEPIS